MKHEVKRLISFVALLVMMVSMLSVCVFPAAADSTDSDYTNLLNGAYVVNPAWENVQKGEAISFVYRGETQSLRFNEKFHFASFAEAWAQAEADGRKDPVILLCAGTYENKIEINGGVTLLGPNAGIDAVDPESKTDDESQPWAKNADRSPEATIQANIVIRMGAKNSNLTFDGLAFGENGAVVDNLRGSAASPGTSEMVFKNLVFEGAGNVDLAKGYAINVDTTDTNSMNRKVYLENIFVSDQSLAKVSSELAAGFISPGYNELYADNIAYLNSSTGFLPISYAAAPVAPTIEVTNSCFYNADASKATGYIISMDNGTSAKKVSSSKWAETVLAGTGSTSRPSALLKVHNNVFYNASSSAKGVIHFELLNLNTVADLQNNVFYSESATSVLQTEFLLDSSGIDQSSCIVIRNNKLIGAYKVPDMEKASEDTYIDMSYNYFADSDRNIVYLPVFANPDEPRLIRTAFWVDEAMTVSSSAWDLAIDWSLSSVNTTHYTGELSLYNQDDSGIFDVGFSAAGGNTTVQLYRTCEMVNDSTLIVTKPIDEIKDAMLSKGGITIYAQVTNSDYPGFAPVYTLTLEKIGTLVNIADFNDVFPEDYLMYRPGVGDAAAGTVVPYYWKDEVYQMTVGKNMFGSIDKLFSYAANNGIEVPTILIPAGTYSDELILSGSCNVIGELHGVNPNKKPYDVIGQDDLLSSAWTLNADWANSEKLTTFNACIRVSDDADDFIITFDGIKMGVGASFVEDQNRYSSNTLVFKNIYMENAGGGTNKAGTANGYLFQFNKTYGVSKDFLNVYLLDSRIDNTGAFHVFGPYAEKLVVDGLYLGKIDGKSFMNNMASRDIADPYVSVTNSYFNQCGLDQTGYNLITLKDTNGLEAKTNIVYNFDNNVFIEAFPAGTPMLNVTFTGKNMKYYFTNNIVYDAKDMHDVFSGDDTYAGTCAQEDVSDMIIFKGNRLVRWRRLPVTTGVGAGTSIDFSGNYFAITTSDTLGLTPADADVDSLRASSTNAVELEAARRRKVDYTYLDWDMTIRSDCAELNKTAYSFTKGMFGTGTNKVEEVDGVNMPVYRDANVPADCEVYELPFTTSEYADVKIYTSPSCIDTFLVDELRLTSTTNKFYVKVNSVDGTTAQTFAIYIDRLENTEASLVAFDDFVIDDKAETVTGHVDRRYIYLKSTVEVSNGATFVMYDDAACTIPTSESDVSFRPTASAPVVKYIKVTSEDGAVEKVYTFTLNLYSDVSEIDVAGISSVTGMTRVDASNFKMAVSPAADVFTFAPVAYVGSILDVYNGNELLVPDANGVYTVVNSGDFNQTLRVVATAGDGVTVKEYRLTVVKEDSSECDLLAVESAVKTSSGFAMLFNHSQSMVLNATVTPGASYEVYADYACTKLYDGNLVILDDNSNTFAYVKVTSEDGKHTAIHKVTLLAQPGNRASTPVVTATVGNKTYTSVTTGANELTIYLPAGTTSAVLSAKYSVKEPTSTIKLFADPNCSTELNAALSLDTKITKAYLSTTAGSYKVDRIVPESSDNEASTTLTVSGVLPLSEWVINVVADQDTVVYSDANDIAEWVAPYVDYLNNNNYKIFAGDQNKKFNASLNITRNEIAIIATRVMGLDVTKYSGVQLTFADSVVDWALPYVKAAVSANIINGSLDATTGLTYFNGDNNATREQVMKILVSILAVQNGIDDVAAYYTAHKNDIDLTYNSFNFADDDKVSEWAVPFIHMAVAKYGLVNGSPVNGELYLNPQQYITRAEVAKIVACMLGY